MILVKDTTEPVIIYLTSTKSKEETDFIFVTTSTTSDRTQYKTITRDSRTLRMDRYTIDLSSWNLSGGYYDYVLLPADYGQPILSVTDILVKDPEAVIEVGKMLITEETPEKTVYERPHEHRVVYEPN